MNCLFDQANGFPATCSACGRVVRSGTFPIYAACRARGGSTLAEAVASAKEAEKFGSGTELHALLGKFGLHASRDCKCKSRVRYMNQMGADWCEANIDAIVGWLREAAEERGLPFVDIAARLLVRRAIANARKAETRRGQEAEAAAAEGPAA